MKHRKDQQLKLESQIIFCSEINVYIGSITLVFSYYMSTVSFAIQAQFPFLDVVPPLQANYHSSQMQPLLAQFGSDHNH